MDVTTIVQGCKAGDTKCQKALYDMLSRQMMGVCLRYIGDRDDAQDVLQDGFVRVFGCIHTLRDPELLHGWVRRIIVNSALTEVRSRRESARDFDMDFLPAAGHGAVSALGVKDLLQVISKLPNGQRAIFNMHAVEGYKHSEIGEILGISEGTSKSQYLRARAKLREMVGGYRLNN